MSEGPDLSRLLHFLTHRTTHGRADACPRPGCGERLARCPRHPEEPASSPPPQQRHAASELSCSSPLRLHHATAPGFAAHAFL